MCYIVFISRIQRPLRPASVFSMMMMMLLIFYLITLYPGSWYVLVYLSFSLMRNCVKIIVIVCYYRYHDYRQRKWSIVGCGSNLTTWSDGDMSRFAARRHVVFPVSQQTGLHDQSTHHSQTSRWFHQNTHHWYAFCDARCHSQLTNEIDKIDVTCSRLSRSTCSKWNGNTHPQARSGWLKYAGTHAGTVRQRHKTPGLAPGQFWDAGTDAKRGQLSPCICPGGFFRIPIRNGNSMLWLTVDGQSAYTTTSLATGENHGVGKYNKSRTKRSKLAFGSVKKCPQKVQSQTLIRLT